MLTKSAKLLLVATSFAPVLLTYAIVAWVRGTFLYCGIILVSGAAFLVCMCLAIVHIAQRKLEIIDFPVKALKTADGEIVGFLVAYLLPLVNSSSDTVEPRVLLFVLGLFLLVVWSTHAYHINPILGLFGYHFYEVESTDNVTYLLMTKRDLRHTRSVTRVVQITDYMVLDAMEVV